jgi:hypothetical protein
MLDLFLMKPDFSKIQEIFQVVRETSRGSSLNLQQLHPEIKPVYRLRLTP